MTIRHQAWYDHSLDRLYNKLLGLNTTHLSTIESCCSQGLTVSSPIFSLPPQKLHLWNLTSCLYSSIWIVYSMNLIILRYYSLSQTASFSSCKKLVDFSCNYQSRWSLLVRLLRTFLVFPARQCSLFLLTKTSSLMV